MPQSAVGKRDAGRIAEDDAYQAALERRRASREGAKRALTSGPGRALRALKARPRETLLIVTPGALSGAAAYNVGKGRKSEAAAAVAGGAAAQGAYQGAAYGLSGRARTKTGHNLTAADFDGGKTPAGLHPSLRSKEAWQAHHDKRRAHLKGKSPKEAYRTFPKELKYSRLERTLGHTHGGRLGTAIGTAVTLTGAGAAARTVRKRDYGYMERRTDLTRVAEAGVGTGLAAYGLSRMRMVGSLARYGARIAERQGAKPKDVERVMSAAAAVGRGVRTATGAGESQVRRVRVLNNAVEQIPLALRPAVATTAGVMLVQHARPVRQDRFHRTGSL